MIGQRASVGEEYPRLRATCAALLAAAALVLTCRSAPHLDEPRQIILISIDTLRADYLGPWRDDWGYTPHLDHFAEESVVFTDARTASPSTTRSHKSLFYGLYNHVHKTAMWSFPTEERLTSPIAALAEAGVPATAFFCRGGLNRRNGVLRGFADLHPRRCLFGHEKRDLAPLTQASQAWLEEHADRPFLLFLHTYEPHAPYDAPAELLEAAAARHGPFASWPPPRGVLRRRSKPWRDELTPENVRLLHTLYEAEVETVDRWFGELLSRLERLGIAEHAAILVLSDHGEALGEGDWVGHSHFGEEQLRVPLLMKLPGAHPQRIDSPVSLVDVMPTLLDLLDVAPPYEFQGVSLLPAVRGDGEIPSDRVRIVEHDSRAAIYHSAWKLYFDVEAPGSEVLTSREHGYEGENLAGSERAVVADLMRRYASVRRRAAPLAGKFTFPPGKPAEFSPQTLEQLRALGYLD